MYHKQNSKVNNFFNFFFLREQTRLKPLRAEEQKSIELQSKRDEGFVLVLQIFGLNFVIICKVLENPP